MGRNWQPGMIAVASPATSGPVHWTARTRKHAPLAKPNYSFEKRQRELAKKKKKDEKLARKQESRDDAAAGTASTVPPGAPDASGK